MIESTGWHQKMPVPFPMRLLPHQENICLHTNWQMRGLHQDICEFHFEFLVRLMLL
jgi:hypothetical protein